MSDIRNVTRRDTLALGAGALAASIAAPACANEGAERHGMSSFGDLKYPATFKHALEALPLGGVADALGEFPGAVAVGFRQDDADGCLVVMAAFIGRASVRQDDLGELQEREIRPALKRSRFTSNTWS